MRISFIAAGPTVSGASKARATSSSTSLCAETPRFTVVAVGPGRWADDDDRIPMDVKEGDTVIFSRYGGTELKYDGQEYLLLSQRDILAVIEK